jgi:hypothetical protein
MSYAEKITAYEAKRVSLAAGLQTIMESADAEGTTLDAEQDEQFEELKGQIEAIDKQLARYRDLENLAAKAAVPAAGKTSDEGSQSRGGEAIIVKTQPKLEPGMEFARLMKAYGEAKGNMDLAARIAQNRYGPDSNAYGALKRIAERGQQRLQWDGYEKANVLAGSTASSTRVVASPIWWNTPARPRSSASSARATSRRCAASRSGPHWAFRPAAAPATGSVRASPSR